MTTILRTTNLTKKYGSKTALDNLTLGLQKGEVLGVLGPNGSGKTTFLKIIAGMHKKTSGEITICGEEPGIKTKGMVSYLPDRNFLYKWMKISDAKDFYRDFFPDFNEQSFVKMMEVMNLDINQKISSLSKGMQEKLNVALCFSREAKLYVLDEPIGGVDPLARDMILDSIIDRAYDKKTIIITTQLVRDIENIFDRCVFLSDGATILSGNAEDIRNERGMSIEETFKEIYRGQI
ncbi:ABC transporter ATP-binding protein [uncultured Ezakiella sp.]|uniref:ABC transporter ATP-binding protein n=1 Tax=uncultured Ezakiella sp. TaxID=1637529 RepID=UPI0025DFD0B7|nr:ABC transporter ATP-binding protein [uncultured Ezakiella sp.]